MSILRRLVERRDLFSSNLNPNSVPSNTDGYLSAVGSVTPESSLRIAAVYACVRLLSQSVAGLPADVFRKIGKTRVELSRPVWMDQPNPRLNWMELVEQLMCSLLLWGNAYAIRVYDDNGELVELWPLNPAWVRVTVSGGRILYKVTRQNRVDEFSADEVFHVRGLTLPGSAVGLSPIDHARLTLGLAGAAEEFGARFFSNGTVTSGVVEFPGPATDEQLKLIARSWKAAHQGIARAHEPGFLTGGAKWTPITIPNDSAQFIESRKFGVTEIGRWFGVQPHKIGDLERATFSNIEHQAIEFVVDGVQPWVTRLEHAFRPLLGRGAAPDRRTTAYLKFNLTGLLRGDMAARASFYSVMRNLGTLNADEIRALEDLEPIPGGLGKDYWHPANMGVAGEEPPAPAPAPTPTPSMERAAQLIAAGNGNGRSLQMLEAKAAQEAERRHSELLAAVSRTHLITVNTPDVHVDVQPPAVNVDARTSVAPRSPDVHVAPPAVNVAAPVVNVAAPEARAIVKRIHRDVDGNITTITEEAR